MFTFLVILSCAVLAALIISTGMKPEHGLISVFELERREQEGDHSVRSALDRERYFAEICSLHRLLTTLLLVMSVYLIVLAFGWLAGVILALVVVLEYGVIARLQPVLKVSRSLYVKLEPAIIRLIERFPKLFQLLRNVPYESTDQFRRIDSRPELERLIERAESVLTTDERAVIRHSLAFDRTLVNTIMTPRSMINVIDKKELLGPLVLDDLHKHGHSRVPVIDGDIDHTVGILHLQSLLALDVKRSTTAEKAMEPKVFYIREDQTLQHALAAFIKTKHHLFIVVNEFRETVGLLSLEDVIEALLGRRIIDEFDTHEDLRAVALRNPHDNNSPRTHRDV
ncbi:MAG: hypothetical protein JWN33_75 [Candidatus Saccharibacteria bacterium]|nr:hypothetical protein [Candidatus Saccharibacteria bacterium]